MTQRMNKSLDDLSEYLAPRKGLLPLIGIVFVIANFILQFFELGWLSDSNLFLHLGVIIAVFGLMLAWAL
jgi:hypothetical protein